MKIILSLLLGVAFAFSAVTCAASVSPDKIALAGVKIGMSASDVTRIAGQPNSKKMTAINGTTTALSWSLMTIPTLSKKSARKAPVLPRRITLPSVRMKAF